MRLFQFNPCAGQGLAPAGAGGPSVARLPAGLSGRGGGTVPVGALRCARDADGAADRDGLQLSGRRSALCARSGRDLDHALRSGVALLGFKLSVAELTELGFQSSRWCWG